MENSQKIHSFSIEILASLSYSQERGGKMILPGVGLNVASFPQVLEELQKSISDASSNQQAMSHLLEQKQVDFTEVDQALENGLQEVPNFLAFLQNAQTALLGVSPFVSCDIQTGQPDCQVQGKALVTQPLESAYDTAGKIASYVQSASQRFANKAEAVQSLPDRASLFSGQISLCINLIEEAKGLLPSGDARIQTLENMEALLQSPDEKSALAPFLSGYTNTQTFVNQAQNTASQALSDTQNAQSSAEAMDCQGDCGSPSPIDGTYNPVGTGVITGMDDAAKAILQACQSADALAPSLTSAKQAMEDLQGKLNPLVALFQKTLQNLEKAKALADGMGSP
jgi:hypothetical protein